MTPSFIIVALCITASQGSRKHVREFEIQHLLPKDQWLELSMWKDFSHKKNHTKTASDLNVEAFSWNDCGSSSALVNIQSLSLGPDPLTFPGPVNVASVFTVKKALNAPLMGQVKVYKKILFYIHVKTFHFDDLCDILARHKDKCPDPLKKIGINCSCPIAAKTYNLEETRFNAPDVPIPGGSYRINTEVSMGGSQAACIDVYFSVE